MASEDMYKVLREAIINNDKDEVERILYEHADIDIITRSGNEENLINVAIENTDAQMLALLLGIQGPLSECINSISDSQYYFVNHVCDSKGNSPLLKAVQLGNLEMVSLLLLSGAEVNYFSKKTKMAAIDLSTDPDILLALFQSDSKFPIDEKKSELVKRIINRDENLYDFFKKRDELHELIKKGGTKTIKSLNSYFKMDNKQRKYCVNSQGDSLLYTALKNKVIDTWANLKDLGMCYTTKKENSEEEDCMAMCERALSKLLISLEDCHLMKLLSKSAIPQRVSPGMKIVSEYFDYLNEIEITKTLMEVVQDIPGLQIVFDLESTSIERIRPCSSDEVRGIVDFDLVKVFVAAKSDDDHGLPEISSNLAHELCHLAMEVVYENNGLPYRRGHMEKEMEYEELMKNIKTSTGCGDIISKVWECYPNVLHGRELIVRVPEMTSLHKRSRPDFSSLLNEQVKALMCFYEKNVQPDFRKYIESICTSNKILCRSLMSYMKLLSPVERIQVNDSIYHPIIGKHNDLHVVRASDVKLAKSHLKSFFRKEGKVDPYFCDWSLYKRIRANTEEGPDGIKKCLNTGEIETLVMSWDIDEIPPFCAKERCIGNCVGTYLRDYTNCIYLLVSTKWSVLKNIESNNYTWNHLSLDTKKMIQERDVEIGGKLVELKTLIIGSEGEDHFEEFMRECLDFKDINMLLGDEGIKMGKTNLLLGSRGENMVFKHPDVFITRNLTRNIVKFDGDMIRRLDKDVFFISNVTMSYLCSCGISESIIVQWSMSTSYGLARCYVLHTLPHDKNEESIFQEVLKHLRVMQCKQVKMLHHLKFRQGFFAHIKSVNILNDNYMDKVEGLIHCIDKRGLEALDLEGSDPFLVADDPGTGKTTLLHILAKKIKQYHPEKWISIVDLSLQAQQKHLMAMEEKKSSSEKETLDFLFQMVGSGRKNSLEKRIFNEFSKKKNKIILFFDGFDEICPHYKSVATSFIVTLRKIRGNIKLAVSTRLHEKHDLEEALDIISYQLIPFNENDQITFLNEYWNELLSKLSLSEWQEKMKCYIESSEIWVKEKLDDSLSELISGTEEILKNGKSMKKMENKINFIPVARRILLDQEPVFKGLEKFTGTPLHVQMAANLIFEDSFKMKGIMNLGHLYQRFFILKMDIYNQEKAHSSGNIQSKETTRIMQEGITRTLEKLSVGLLQEGNSCEMKDNEKRAVCNIGLMSQVGEDYQFIHRTYAEFFFARRMLRKAGKNDVTKLWLERLYVEDQFARVRKFVEDILYLLSEGYVDSKRSDDFLMLKKANLNQSVIDDPLGLNDSIYQIVHECSVYTLQYFADAFGKKLAKSLIQEFHPNYFSVAVETIISRVQYSRPMTHHGIIYNALTFAALCFSDGRVFARYVTLVKLMLYVLKKYEMLNEIKHLLLTKGLVRLIPTPPKNSEGNDGHVIYSKEVLTFLLDNKEIFGDILRDWITLLPKLSTVHCAPIFFQRLITLHFDLLQLVMGALYDETQLKSMLVEKGFILNVWINITGKYKRHGTEQVWILIKEGLGMDVTHLKNYLLWKDGYKFNSLCRSAYNDDPEVIEFIWELASELMGDQERKTWLFDSFGCGVWLTSSFRCTLKSKEMYLGWSFHKFLARRVNSGFISEDEMLCLLKSKDNKGECYILKGYPLGFLNHVLPIHHLITLETFMNEMYTAFNFKYLLFRLLDVHSSLSLTDDLKDEVDKIFEKVIYHDRYRLAERLDVDECGFLLGVESLEGKIHVDRCKFFVAAFVKQVEFYTDHLKKDGLLSHLKMPQVFNPEGPNILHVVVKYMPSISLGYVSSVLIECLPRDDFLDLLFETSVDGKTVFHKATKFYSDDSDNATWHKLNHVTDALLGKDAVSSSLIEKFIRQDMPVSLEALEDLLARWKRIWTSQKEVEQSVIALSQITDEEVMDDDQGEKEMVKEEEEIDQRMITKKRRLM